MITKKNKIKCDNCGKFISLNDLMAGHATHECILPDSHFSVETFESFCSKCNKKFS